MPSQFRVAQKGTVDLSRDRLVVVYLHAIRSEAWVRSQDHESSSSTVPLNSAQVHLQCLQALLFGWAEVDLIPDDDSLLPNFGIHSQSTPQSPVAAVAVERLPARRNLNDLPGWRVGRPLIFKPDSV